MNAIYKTVAKYSDRSSEVTEKETTIALAQAWLADTCKTFRSLSGYDVHSTPDNRFAVIVTVGYRLEITVEPK